MTSAQTEASHSRTNRVVVPNRVVITGMGAITPSGLNVAELWRSVRDGVSAIDVLAFRGAEQLPVRIGGEVRGFNAKHRVADGLVPPALARRLSPELLWALAAADEAMTQAGADLPAHLPWPSDRVSVIAATGSGPVIPMQEATRLLDAKGPRAVPLSLAMHGAPDSAAALLSQRYGFHGPAQGLSATCASGAVALGEAQRRIRHGYADAVLVVGVENCLGAVNLASNANLRALAAGYELDPTAASRPFDRARSGFVMSAGACAILLESEAAARARGALPLAELAGFGAASDAHHATAPDPEGRGAARAVAASLADAGVTPAEIGHINAHGTGTPAGDAAELLALALSLGEAARATPISATKSSTGHLLGAAGVVEAIVTVMSLREGLLPPTLNLADPEYPDWNIVAGNAQHARIDTALSTSFGFGGHNAAIVLRTVEGMK